MKKSYDVLIVGIGGQGTILASNVLGDACVIEGRHVRGAETHGMSQRGGSVETHIRIDGKFGSLIAPGSTDLLMAFDVLEANLAEWIERKEFVKNDLVSETLAAELGVSLTVFRAYFKDRLGTEFRQWRMCLRIEYACDIMRQHPDYTYSMVAEMVGIGDRSNFNKAFVKVKGMTPKEFAATID